MILLEVPEKSTVSVPRNQIPVEQLGKMPNHTLGNLHLVDFLSTFLRQRSNSAVIYSTGNDKLEKVQVFVQVECKTVHGDLTGTLHPQRRNLARIHSLISVNPDTC